MKAQISDSLQLTITAESTEESALLRILEKYRLMFVSSTCETLQSDVERRSLHFTFNNETKLSDALREIATKHRFEVV